ncbi:MAG: glycosyltransferase [Clostridia bacterium]|nr:glycosyltransferase [Clostridia bacterium]
MSQCMGDTDIKVSIITATYNSSSTLKRTMKSVLEQTYSHLEYIIMDGASEDDTLEIARSFETDFAKAGKELRIFSVKDRGMYDAINKGVDIATGVLIGNVNSDDFYEPDAVENVVNEYLKEPYDMIYGDLRIYKKAGSFIKKARLEPFVSTRYWNHPTTFITKETYSKEKYRVESMYDDYDLMLRLRKGGYRVRVVNKVLSNFTFGGMSTQKSLKKTFERIKLNLRICRRNGYGGPRYIIDNIAKELVKYIMG